MEAVQFRDYDINDSYAGYTKKNVSAYPYTKKKSNGSARSVIIICGLLLICVLAFLAFLCIPGSKAVAKDNCYSKRIVSVRVNPNDTLWDIAQKYYSPDCESIPGFIEQIKKTNHLNSDTIYPDTYLVISYLVPNK